MMILTTILDVATAVVRLVEAEGRVLRRAVMRTGWALVFVALAACSLLAATGFMLAALYQYLSMEVSAPVASLIVALAALVVALVFAGIARVRAASSD
jgi:hypothetical protein